MDRVTFLSGQSIKIYEMTRSRSVTLGLVTFFKFCTHINSKYMLNRIRLDHNEANNSMLVLN